jgi:hypothetical protein
VGPGDEVVVSSHGYPTAAYAQSRGATATTATFGLGDGSHEVVDALARAVTDRTRLVIIDHITSPTALVLPVAEVAAAVAPGRSCVPARAPADASLTGPPAASARAGARCGHGGRHVERSTDRRNCPTRRPRAMTDAHSTNFHR